MFLRQRSYQKELIDDRGIPFEDLQKNMEELAFINAWLGGHRVTLEGLRRLGGISKTLRVCEIGCGGGDNLKTVYQWAIRNKIEVQLIGIDINPGCITLATKTLGEIGCTFFSADYKTIAWPDQKPDIIFSSLFCHHFTNDELIELLQWMKQNSQRGFFINDLHRHALAYYSIKLLTQLFSFSYLVKNDAPLSVKRGFVKKDWKQLCSLVSIDQYLLQWKWAFRWLLVYVH